MSIGMSARRAPTIAMPMPPAKILQAGTLAHETPATAAMVLSARTTMNARMTLILAMSMLLARTRLVASLAPVTLVSRAMVIPAPTSTNVTTAIMEDVIPSRRALIRLEAIIALPAHRATQEPASPVVSRLSLPLLIRARASWSHPGLPLIPIRLPIPAGDTRPVTRTYAHAMFPSGRRFTISFGLIGW